MTTPPAAPPVAVISHHAWRRTYGGDPSVVGSTFVVEGHPFTVIGVAPPGFFGETLRGDPPDLWIPVNQEAAITGDGALLHQSVAAWLRVIGRLRPGASTAGMAPRLTGILRQWMQNDSGYPSNWMPDVIRMLPKQSINVVPAGAGVAEMKEQYGRSLHILLAVCGMVLLIACANVANLLLARAVARRTQTALRLAMGASGRQIVMQALTESVLLAIAGGIAGLAVAAAAARLLLVAGIPQLAFSSHQHCTVARWCSLFSFAVALRDRRRLWRGPRLVCHANRPGRSAARRRAAPSAIILRSPAKRCWPCKPPFRRSGGRRHHAGPQPQQARDTRTSDTRWTGAWWFL